MQVSARSVVMCIFLTGCTSGMHRAYQHTMAVAASSLFVMDGAQTTAALRRGDADESNPAIVAAFGSHPSPAAIWAIAGGQAAVTPLIAAIPGRRGSDDTGEWLKDGLLTALVMLEAFTVANNAEMRGRPLMSSWH